MSPSPIASISAPLGSTVRAILETQLEKWDHAALRVRHGDADAVHDFRVALRRLRTTLGAFESCLASRPPKSLDRDLRSLARASGLSRDLQVHRSWVSARRDRLADPQAAGATWFLGRLEHRQRKADRALADRVARRYRRTRAGLERMIAELATEHPRPARESVPARRIVGSRLALQADDLARKLALVRDVGSVAESHRARIAAKRLRYLIEPFAGELAGANQVVVRLEALQDLLGTLHDRHALADLLARGIGVASKARAEQQCRELLPGIAAERDPADPAAAAALPGLFALARELRAQADDLFSNLDAEWLRGRAKPLTDRAATLLDEPVAPTHPPMDPRHDGVQPGSRAPATEAEAGPVDPIRSQ